MSAVGVGIAVTCVAVLVWTWVGYPAAVRWAAGRMSVADQGTPHPGPHLPGVSVVLPVHNGAHALGAKLDGLVEAGRAWTDAARPFEIIVVLDGCTDSSEDAARSASRRHAVIRVVTLPRRAGKSRAQNEAIAHARGDVVVLTDLDTSFSGEDLARLVRPFQQEEVGYATGDLRWRDADSPLQRSGSAYAGWERRLWAHESALGILHVATGAFMAVRRRLFVPLEPDVGDDAMVPLDVIAQGYRGCFVPEARAWDDHHADLPAEFRARVRMTARSLRATLRGMRRGRLWRRPVLLGAVVSHRLLRWTTPVWLLGSAVGVGAGVWPLAPRLWLGAAVAAATASLLPPLRHVALTAVVVNAAFLAGCVGAFTGVASGPYRTAGGRPGPRNRDQSV